jgi:hypothetical protein
MRGSGKTQKIVLRVLLDMEPMKNGLTLGLQGADGDGAFLGAHNCGAAKLLSTQVFGQTGERLISDAPHVACEAIVNAC